MDFNLLRKHTYSDRQKEVRSVLMVSGEPNFCVSNPTKDQIKDAVLRYGNGNCFYTVSECFAGSSERSDTYIVCLSRVGEIEFHSFEQWIELMERKNEEMSEVFKEKKEILDR